MEPSTTDVIFAELAGALQSLGQARQHIAEAGTQARKVAAQAAQAGYRAIATAMAGISDLTTAANGMLATAHSHGQAAEAAVRGLSGQMNPGQVAEHLDVARQAVDDMRQALLGAAQQLSNTAGRVEATLRGGQPGPLLARLEAARQCLAAAAQRGSIAQTQIDANMAQIDGLGAPDRHTGGAVPQSPTPADASTRIQADTAVPVPTRVAEMAARLPRRQRPTDKTEGFLLVDDAVVRDRLFAAEPDGRLRSRQLRHGTLPAAGVGLRVPTARANVMDHVEAQAAAILRKPGAPKDATMILNNAPCDDPVNPLMCEKLLRDIIPRGSTLTVYITDGDRTWLHGMYVGTGKDIA